MNPLTHLLSADQVLLNLDASSKKRVFEQAGILFEGRLGLARSIIFDSLFAREKLGSTGLGQGVAIPHGRIKGLKQAAALTRFRDKDPSRAGSVMMSIAANFTDADIASLAAYLQNFPSEPATAVAP